MMFSGIQTIFWIVIGGIDAFFALGVIQGAVTWAQANRKNQPADRQTAQDDIWHCVIAIAIISAIAAAVWAIVSPSLQQWMSNIPSAIRMRMW